EQNGSGRCEPCGYGEYMEYPNAFQWCRDCLKCREDQVELSPCQPVRNTVCACRNGTFCPPDHPCEMCQKCRPRCPEGQVMLKPCRADSDLQCGPATDTVPPCEWGRAEGWGWELLLRGRPGAAAHTPVVSAADLRAIIGVVAFLVVAGIVLCFWKLCCSSPGGCRGPSGHPPWPGALHWCGLRDPRSTHQVWAGWEQGPREHPPGVGWEKTKMRPPGLCWGLGLLSQLPVLAPALSCPLPPAVLRRSFYTFARKVPKDHWKKFGRSLDLEENDVVVTTTSDDAFYEMLYKWQSREGSKSSVNTLLETLGRLHLGGVAEDISSTLVQNGLFQYETS
ncbi:TR10B factor, partial [Nicator chloris]|nr:TR10B factor [Nicator chloris]